jgi:hypothetical protein
MKKQTRKIKFQTMIDNKLEENIKEFSDLFGMTKSTFGYFSLIGMMELLKQTTKEMYDDLGIDKSKLPEKIHPYSKSLGYIKGISILKSAIANLPIENAEEILKSLEKIKNKKNAKQEDFDELAKVELE